MTVGTSWNILRPETIESLFYLWRFTGNKTYQEWGWNIFQAFEKNSRTETGYVGLKDVKILKTFFTVFSNMICSLSPEWNCCMHLSSAHVLLQTCLKNIQLRCPKVLIIIFMKQKPCRLYQEFIDSFFFSLSFFMRKVFLCIISNMIL